MASKSNRQCILMRGYAGCGKSTEAEKLAKEYNAVICSADDYWMKNGKYCFVMENLHLAHAACFDKFKNAVKNGENVIIDNTNLKFEDIQKYVDHLIVNNNHNRYIYAVDIKEVRYNSIDKAIEHRSNREDGKNIPVDQMKRMEALFNRVNAVALFETTYGSKINFIFERQGQENNFFENFCGDIVHNAVICDLDGTLALHKMLDGTSLRNPYDASKSANDIINVAVALTLRALQSEGYEIIFVTGRKRCHEAPTIEFLNRVADKYGLDVEEITLHMRADDDDRSDAIVKAEIYADRIKPHYEVLAVFDDRPRVVEVWRKLGLMVFDCNYRNEDF